MGLSGRFKAAKDRLFRRWGYQPITTPTAGANTTPAPAAAPNQAPATTPVTAPVSNPVSSTPAPAPAAAPVTAPVTQATQNPSYSSEQPRRRYFPTGFHTTPAPAAVPNQAPAEASSTSAEQFRQRFLEFTKPDKRFDPYLITINPPGMDRWGFWKPFSSMGGNRNTPNTNYYATKSTNSMDKVVNPVTAKFK